MFLKLRYKFKMDKAGHLFLIKYVIFDNQEKELKIILVK